MAKKVVREEVRKKPTRSDLGAGLRAVFNADKLEEAIATDQEAVIKELANHFLMIPIDQIERNNKQPRTHFSDDELNELADSIRIHGIIQPITVRRLEPRRFQIISGERRFKASQIAELTEIPAFIRTANDTVMLEMALLENTQRQDLNPMEIAYSYSRLIGEFKLSQEQLSERIGKIDRTTVTNYLRLLKLEKPVQDALRAGIISFGHGKVLAGVTIAATQLSLLREIIEKGLSVKGLEDFKKSLDEPTQTRPAQEKIPEDYKNVEQKFQEFFGVKKLQLKVNVEGKGQIVIPFANTKALNELLDRLEENH